MGHVSESQQRCRSRVTMETEANGRSALLAGAEPIARGGGVGVAGANGRDLGVVCESFKSGWGLWQSAVRRTPTRLESCTTWL